MTLVCIASGLVLAAFAVLGVIILIQRDIIGDLRTEALADKSSVDRSIDQALMVVNLTAAEQAAWDSIRNHASGQGWANPPDAPTT